MIRFCSNATGWDELQQRMYPGGMTDTMIAPIVRELEAARVPWEVDRWPRPGAVNVYLATSSVYEPHLIGGPCAPMICHGIADKNYRTVGRGGMHPFSHIGVPGPAHAQRAQGLANVVVLGYPKLVPLFDGTISRVPRPAGDERIRVLWAPTHGGGGEAEHMDDRSRPAIAAAHRTMWWDREQVLELLPPDRFHVVAAPHPRHRADRRATLAEYAAADVVVADAGSTIYESWAYGLPVVFCDWLTAERTAARPHTLEGRIYRQQLGFHAHRPEQLPEVVAKAAAEGMGAAEHEFIEHVLPTSLRAASGALHAEFLAGLWRTHRTYLEEQAMARRFHNPEQQQRRRELTNYLARRRGNGDQGETNDQVAAARRPRHNPPMPTGSVATPSPGVRPAAARAAGRPRSGTGAQLPYPGAATANEAAGTEPATTAEESTTSQAVPQPPPQPAGAPDSLPLPGSQPARAVQPPPQSGRGSGAEAWREFLTTQGHDPARLADMNRQQLIALYHDPQE